MVGVWSGRGGGGEEDVDGAEEGESDGKREYDHSFFLVTEMGLPEQKQQEVLIGVGRRNAAVRVLQWSRQLGK